MQPEKLTVMNLFSDSRRYIVPLYQRSYVWRRDSQWEPLWRDVRARAEELLLATSNTNRDDLPSHFLGAIVLEPYSVGLRSVPAYGVIDGQQRLTTLQVFLAAFRDLTVNIDPVIHEELQKATRNTGMSGAPEEQYKVWPTNFDRNAFKLVMDAESPATVEAAEQEARENWESVPQLVLAYRFFSHSISEWLQEPAANGTFSVTERCAALFYALRDSLQVVAIRLERGDDPQIIFETLNARGVPLLPTDLIRNYVFTAANREGMDTDRLYAKYWRELDGEATVGDSFWRGTERVGRERRSRLVLFFYHFLMYKLEHDIPFTGVFEAFREWWNSRSDKDVERGLEEIVRASRAYRRIIDPSSDDRFGVFAHRLKALDITTLHPLLLYLLLDSDLKRDDLSRAVGDLESYLIRRLVCGLTMKNYNRFFMQLLVHLSASDNPAHQSLREFLAAGSGDSVRWPSDSEFSRNWPKQPLYRRARAAVAPILQAIDANMTNGLQEELHLKQTPTVEHVLPRNWQAHWPPPADDLATDDEYPEDVRNRLLHSFGNLTLLTNRLNSKVKNSAFAAKKREIIKQSALRLNTYFQDLTEWDEVEIRKRGQVLLTEALEIWPATVEQRGDTAADGSSEAVSTPLPERHDPRLVLERASKQLELDLPPPFSVKPALKRGYIQVLHDSWLPGVHYELRLASGSMFVELHCELASKHESRDDLLRIFEELKPRIASQAQDLELSERATSRHWIGWRLPLASSESELVQALQDLVVLTRKDLERYFSILADSQAA